MEIHTECKGSNKKCSDAICTIIRLIGIKEKEQKTLSFSAPFTLANPACTNDDQQNEQYNKQRKSACKTATAVATTVASRITAKAHNLAPPLSNQDTFIKYAADTENEINLSRINENAYSIKLFFKSCETFSEKVPSNKGQIYRTRS